MRLLQGAGCQVEAPRAQTCCGQVAYNSGDRSTARALGITILDAFGGYDYVVVPSGSCGSMLKFHLPLLLDDDPNLRSRAYSLAERTFELISFLSDVMKVEQLPARHAGGPVTYHDSCSGLRELKIKEQPRRLLRAIGATISEMPDAEVCCGFGGTFCVKYPDISVRMASDKVGNIIAAGAETVIAGDLGCLLNIAGRLHREGHHVQTRHVAELLAGMTKDVPAIGESSE